MQPASPETHTLDYVVELRSLWFGAKLDSATRFASNRLALAGCVLTQVQVVNGSDSHEMNHLLDLVAAPFTGLALQLLSLLAAVVVVVVVFRATGASLVKAYL